VDTALSDLGRAVAFAQIAQESTRQDYLHEVEHMRRIVVEAAWSYRRPPGIW